MKSCRASSCATADARRAYRGAYKPHSSSANRRYRSAIVAIISQLLAAASVQDKSEGRSEREKFRITLHRSGTWRSRAQQLNRRNELSLSPALTIPEDPRRSHVARANPHDTAAL